MASPGGVHIIFALIPLSIGQLHVTLDVSGVWQCYLAVYQEEAGTGLGKHSLPGCIWDASQILFSEAPPTPPRQMPLMAHNT